MNARSGPLGGMGFVQASQLIGQPLTIENTGTTSTDDATLIVKTSGASGGDPKISLRIGSTRLWNLGADNSVSGDPLSLSADSGGDVGATPVLTMTTAGVLTMPLTTSLIKTAGAYVANGSASKLIIDYDSAVTTGAGLSGTAAAIALFKKDGMTVLGQCQVLIGSANAANAYAQLGFGYNNGTQAYAPACISYIATSGSGSTKGDLIIATRSATTDTIPAEAIRFTAAGDTKAAGAIIGNGASAKLIIDYDAVITTGAGMSGTAGQVAIFKKDGLVTLGQCQVLIGSANNTNAFAQLGFGYTNGSQAYAPACIGYIATSGSGSTKGDFFIATRAATTDTVPADNFRVTAGGNIIIGAQAALLTTATDGFAYMPSCAGLPTGVPTAYTGKVPWTYDATNNKISIYNGAWKQTAALT